jgi:hypothetical protein
MPEMTQERATRLITCAYLSGGEAFDLALHRIEFDDGTVDYDAWRSNRINIFQRWRKCETSGQRKKMQLLTPAILAAIKAENADLYKQVTAGNSVDYLVSRLLKENADAASAALNDAPLIDFERECDEAEQAITALRRAYRQQRHDQ